MRIIRIHIQRLLLLICCLTSLLAGGIETAVALPNSDLDEILVTVSPEQVVNQPLIGTAQLLLLDSLSAPVTDYILAAEPILLSVDVGTLSPSLLDSSELLVNGLIDLLPLNVRYTGLSGLRTVTAANDSVASPGLLISFNGYDVLSVFDIIGNDITTVYSGLPTTLNVEVKNGGNLLADSDPYVKAFFTSDVSGSVKRFFTGASGGTIDTVGFLLENTLLVTGHDTLVLLLHSEYMISGLVYTTEDTLLIPVEVKEAATFAIPPATISPAAIYAGSEFDLSFHVIASEFFEAIDSTYLSVDLTQFIGGPVIANLFMGAPTASSVVLDTLKYDSLTAVLDSLSGISAGDYYLKFDYRLVSGANIFSLIDPSLGIITVLEKPLIEYESGSLSPLEVAIDQEVQFNFSGLFTSLAVSSTALIFDSESSSFEIMGDGFSSSTNLIFEQDTIQPAAIGVPVVFGVSSGKIIVPAAMLGEKLSARASFRYRHQTSGNYLRFETTFDTISIDVVELPVAQLIDVEAIVYNSPRVNIGQIFSLKTKVASQSQGDIKNLKLKISSSGESLFESLITVPIISAYDTITFMVPVITAGDAGMAETFTLEILPDSLQVLAPLNNSATVSIDSPALLALTYELNSTSQGNLLERGEGFNLVVSYANSGTSSVDAAAFSFTTGGVDVGVDDPTVGALQDDTTIVFLMTAPNFDTLLNLGFSITNAPVDLNTGLVAPFTGVTYDSSLEVASSIAHLIVEPEILTELLLVPGADVTLMSLTLTNSGFSSLTDMRLHSVKLIFTPPLNEMIEVRDILIVGNSGAYENSIKLGKSVGGSDQLTFYLGEFIIQSGTSRTIELKTRLQESLPKRFAIELDAAGFDIEYVDERITGTALGIQSADGGELQVFEAFQSAGGSFEESFVVETNPFNPNEGDGNVRFAYVVSESSRIEFRIFTLTSELVHEEIRKLGEAGTTVSSQPYFMNWDGTNDAGHLVLNGVYIAQLIEASSNRESYLKIAVVK